VNDAVAFFEGSIYSKVMQMSTSISVSLPNDICERPKGGFPVLYLLHGLFDDHTAWARRTNIDRYAGEHGLAVVMPEVQRSFYTDMEYGFPYFTYISDELPKLCREMFGFSPERKDTFVAGLSMGGYGALKCGLRRPDVFSACAGISSVVDLKSRVGDYINRPDMRNAFGDPAILPDQDDLFLLVDKLAALSCENRPRIFLCCGTEDAMLEENRSLKDIFENLGIKNECHEASGGHEWTYWEKVLPQVLDFLRN
jgi:S-formylglutathione hydrolase FrmB